MYRPAVDEILNQHGATDTTVVPEGNVFHLTAKFPDINSAELALAAIREITHRHRS